MAHVPSVVRAITVAFALAAFGTCLAAGIWMMRLGSDDDWFMGPLGLYFIGKAFFVGPLLLINALGLGGNGSPDGRRRKRRRYSM